MSDESGVGGAIAALIGAGPAAGFFLYAGIKTKYRNRHARYKPETVVHHELKDAQLQEELVNTIKTKKSLIDGYNAFSFDRRAAKVTVTKD